MLLKRGDIHMETGIKGYSEVLVSKENVASTVGSGLLDVYSTPSMIALIENAASTSVIPWLEEGQGTVGMHLDISHLAPTPMGEKVWAETELTDISGRILTFTVNVFSDKEKIGEGTHKRCIILVEKFLSKMNSKYNRS